ncbi:MAG: Glycosyl transferase group 1 [Candidatus Woesebacteria bacterium GW2011_GWB1_43_14]|uniref:Glycosyl transferase group 1 n=1 Tax=Candidatus Woesebacteria bacterium GW2011_GWB1_43_14 TaxID=1618578 RepID=A0A0G1DHM5_9BACT|nr:MAG: Glycosyl transferase group 1 [Candidatus Woesebacteria bacterium GW2011_GWA1_39_11b]KKS78399.1 MAG: Glycosyl transferase group 1 [Candidatus Woesebacteria bacterium GW2011_GWC1_42_9]KKS97184.1 MAG: Glycosyl transferase group 1 [Candidatus Woesebacteria bacterium GW2011_GWB1_43_14]
MKIAIDVSQIVYGTGVSVYTVNLVTNLLKVDKKNEYILFAGSLRRRQELKSFYNTKVFPIPPILADLVWNKLHIFPVERLIGEVDVFHSSDWTQPPSGAFMVTTIHDLAPVMHPKWTDPKITRVHKRRLNWVKKEVDKIIVPSVATKNELMKLDFDNQKTIVIQEACNEMFRRSTEEQIVKIRDKYGIQGKYILAVGSGKRKNTNRIILAFEKVRDKLGINNLVLTGRPMDGQKKSEGLIFVDHAPKNELPILYSGAECLVYASLYEGFGLPILEAFAIGTPVVTSSISSMPEIAGDAAILVNPKMDSSIAGGIKRALGDREKLVKKGLSRVKEFSWEKTARETLNVYNLCHEDRN